MNELELVMWYTGWSKEIAESAIKTWKQHNPNWCGAYIAVYLPKEQSLDRR